MTTVWVVLGELGEYSDRSIFVSGVYATKKEARDAVTVASERRRIFDNWNETLRQHQNRLRKLDRRLDRGYLWTPEQSKIWDQLNVEAHRLAGPEPEYERGERFEIVPVELGYWIKS